MTAFPEIEGAFYVFSCAHDYTFIMSRRSFLGIEITSFFYKSIPLVIIPASYYLNEIITCGRRNLKNVVLVAIFMFALLFAGNRAMIGVAFLIFFFVSYGKLSKLPLFKPILVLALISICIIGLMSITEEGEESNDIKFGHLISYSEYFMNNWYMILFGSGAGSLFYSEGFMDMTGITEWTYLEIIRQYGLFGMVVLLSFFLYPLKGYNDKMTRIYSWKAFSLGYMFYLLVSASNPYLLGSTGFLCVLFMFSVVSNPKYLLKVDL